MGKIPENYLEFVNAFTDTILLIDQHSTVHTLENYHNQAIIRNSICCDDYESDYYYEYEEYVSRYRSDSINIKFAIASVGVYWVYYAELHYEFECILYSRDTLSFVYFPDDYFEADSVIEIERSFGNDFLTIKKSLGILSLSTADGNTFTRIDLTEE